MKKKHARKARTNIGGGIRNIVAMQDQPNDWQSELFEETFSQEQRRHADH